MKRMRTVLFAVVLSCATGIVTAASAQATGPASSSPAPPPLLAAPGAGQPAAQPLKFKMYALMAQKKDNNTSELDEEVKPVEGALKSLPYNTYQKISIDERETPEGTDTQFPINTVYSLVIHPEGDDGKGAEKLDIHVDLMQDGKTLKALMAQAAAKPGDMLVLHGMPLAPGDLVLLLQRDPGDQKSQGGEKSQEQEQQQQEQQKQEQQKQDQQESEQKQGEQQKQDETKEQQNEAKAEQQEQNQQEQLSSAEDMKKETEKKDNQNLESILQSLEELDRKEQSEVRNQRDRIDFKGDWW